jgi:hypothetical protein
MSKTPKNDPRRGGCNSTPGATAAVDIKTKKRLEALVTNYLLQGMSEDEANDLALKGVLRRPRPRCLRACRLRPRVSAKSTPAMSSGKQEGHNKHVGRPSRLRTCAMTNAQQPKAPSPYPT